MDIEFPVALIRLEYQLITWKEIFQLKWQLSSCGMAFNTLRPRQNGRHLTDDIFKCIFLYENVWIPIWISLKFVLKGPITNILSLVQIMAWRRPGDKPLSEPMMVSLLAHICVIRPQWVNSFPASAAYMRPWIGSSLAKIMDWRIFGTKPSSKPMSQYKTFHSEKASENIVQGVMPQ